MSELVTVPGETAVSQLIGTSDAPIGSGPLSLHEGTDGGVIVRVGNAAFDVPASTEWFTHAEDKQVYLFQAPFAIGSGSYIKLRLPEGSTARFEEVLVQRGCLKDGPAAVLDELARSVRDDSHLTAVDLSDKADAHISSSSGAAQPTQFSDATKSIVEGARSATGTAAEYTSWAAGAIAGATTALGAKLSEAMGAPATEAEKSDTRKAVESAARQVGDAGSAVGSGISEVTSQAVDSAHRLVKHEHGDEAAELASKTGETTRNVGQVAGDAMVSTSMTGHAAFASTGAGQAAMRPVEPEEKP